MFLNVDSFCSNSQNQLIPYNFEKLNIFAIEEWPIWRTRTPVVIALRHHHGRIEHHRYRYMVVTPGAEAGSRDEFPEQKEGEDEGGEAMNIDTDAGMGLGASTSGQNENNVGTQVMAWEDPFRESNVSWLILHLSHRMLHLISFLTKMMCLHLCVHAVTIRKNVHSIFTISSSPSHLKDLGKLTLSNN